MAPVGFEPTISAGERPQNYALDRAAKSVYLLKINPGSLYIRRVTTGRKHCMPVYALALWTHVCDLS